MPHVKTLHVVLKKQEVVTITLHNIATFQTPENEVYHVFEKRT